MIDIGAAKSRLPSAFAASADMNLTERKLAQMLRAASDDLATVPIPVDPKIFASSRFSPHSQASEPHSEPKPDFYSPAGERVTRFSEISLIEKVFYFKEK